MIQRTALAAVFVSGLIVCTIFDQDLWRWLKAAESVGERDWYRLLRIAGYLPTWVVAAGVVIGASGGRLIRRGIALAGSAAVAGLMAEILKLVIARSRPGEDGQYHYRGLFSGFVDGSNLGMPSSHAAVAFGAAFAASRLFPGAGYVLVPVAAGCGLTRLLMGAHFTSDVWVAAWVGYLAARVCVPSSVRTRAWSAARLPA
ncbi:MAG: phosphatase PAP2 family protein [Phycisphaeraceae bacterium]|nr:phosphatase PAP2 family protein [Phycisphaerae bacterium]MBX3392680.1 phosphatase PAP2 family protein [Phycisphaeraceae bacterium]